MPGGLGFIGWIIVGGLAGWLAGRLMDRNGGILLNIVTGIVGGFLGGWLLGLLGVDVNGGGLLFTFFTAVLGAVILIFLLRAVTGRSRR